jgi:hypothetical protein
MSQITIRRGALAAIAAGALMFACVGVSLANGGSSIATAVPLPLGQDIVGGGTYTCNTCDSSYQWGEYWKVAVLPSDTITIDYSSTDQQEVSLCLFQPSVTDYTVSDSECAAQDETSDKHELKFVFPSGGNWTLNVSTGGCCSNTMAYEMTAYIRHFTHTMVSAPALVNHDHFVTYTGVVSGVTSGKVELLAKVPFVAGWKPIAIAKIGAGGKFTAKVKAVGPGTYKVKAVYAGDSSHLASTAITSFKAI